LFNGNITGLSASYLSPDPSAISLTNLSSAVTVNKYEPYSFMKLFHYDQLNRIKTAAAAAKAVDGSNNWMYTNTGNLTNEFYEEFAYDQNGNILSVDRNLVSGSMDNLTYYYYDQSGTAFNPVSPPFGNLPTNKLAYVTDANGAGTMGDVGNQSSNNYSYDFTGNLTADAAEGITSIVWSAYGKIKSITKSSGPSLQFTYDAKGNRVSKKVLYGSGNSSTTYYVRDATGNVMAAYANDITSGGSVKTLSLKEIHLYGSQRLGLLNRNDMLGYMVSSVNTANGAIITTTENKRILGQKSYELSNHLDNVLAVISDRKIPVDYNANNVMDYFVADIISATDYYAFGSPMPGRQFNNGSYRYSFGGKEQDNEIKGTGNSLDFGARIYDSRIGRWLSVDPLQSKFAGWSPYNFCYDSPISVVDPDGLEGIVVSGAPGDPDAGGHKNKEHFLINGLARAKEAKGHTQRKGEGVTWIIYNGGGDKAAQDPKMLAKYKKLAAKEGIAVMVVTDADEIVDYVNEKNGGDSRSKDGITSFYYVGHATPGDLDVGYGGSGEDFDPDDLKSDAFSSGCYVDLVGGCRTAVPGTFEDSNVTQFQDLVDDKSTVKGSSVRVQYDGGVRNNSQLVKPNDGKVIKRTGNIQSKSAGSGESVPAPADKGKATPIKG
jgi:RHS repeat-associated protein